MQSNVQNSTAADLDLTVNDLGPLAWVMDELRKSLDGAAKALKRFVRDAEAARGVDLAAIDASQLRIARQQLHQAVGALEMVGLTAPVLVLRAMEAAVQKFLQLPEQCTQDAAARIERASFALTEYLEGVLATKSISPVSLFPQYRDVQELVRADRIHPADLWPFAWRWLEPEIDVTVEPLNYDDSACATFDHSILQIMKGRAPLAALNLKDISLGFAARQVDRQPRIFWKIAAAYFEALARDLIGADVYVRRAASRILLQYASLGKGDAEISERLAQDLLFFCSQAVPQRSAETPVLSAVRATFGLAGFKPVDYEAIQFGRFDPALLAQARKRIVLAKETWSSLCAGDTHKLKLIVDQFSLVSDSLVKLHPRSEPLTHAMSHVMDAIVRSGQAPAIAIAMEVATSVLYLEAAFADLDPSDPQLTARAQHLAERLENVNKGGEPQPLQPWMEELYRRVSDKQTMGSVVGELRVSLGELEKSLDLFFRNPLDRTILQNVPGQLSLMRGVLSVLGLDQASQAVLRMRDSVKQMIDTEMDEQRARAAGTFEQLGNNLGALSFLIDMLNYQPVLAKKLFVYDDVKGELRPLMGRTQTADDASSGVIANGNALSQEVNAVVQDAGAGASDETLAGKLDALATHAALAGQPELAKTAHDAAIVVSKHNPEATAGAFSSLVSSVASVAAEPASQVEVADFEEDDLRGIFLEEAREVAANGQEAIRLLADEPRDIGQLIVLRRVFHTLKGSSRMVGLYEFGDAAWSMEQLINSWLADQKPASEELRGLSIEALTGFSRWIEDIATNRADAWTASAFSVGADSMRSEGRLRVLNLPARSPEPPAGLATHELEVIEIPVFDVSELCESVELNGVAVESEVDFDFFFGSDQPSQPSELASLEIAGPIAPALPELQGIDLQSLAALSGPRNIELSPADLAAPSTRELQDQPSQLDSIELEAALVAADTAKVVDMVDLSAADFDEQFLTEVSVLPAHGGSSFNVSADEQIKVIGTLRIGIPLYNVYLNEADEWSRRLVTEVSEWAIEFEHPIGDPAVALAHSLAGSSATVGFNSLSEIARVLEHALQQSQTYHSQSAAAAYVSVFVDAAEDIRRLLHQFAAGFLKESNAGVLARLRQLDFSDSATASLAHAEDFDFSSQNWGPGPEALTSSESSSFREMAQSTPALGQPTADALLGAEQVRSMTAVIANVKRDPAHQIFAPASSITDLSAEIFADAEDDAIDAVDAIDPELFPIFDEEAAELMPQLGGALRQWSSRPGNQVARMEVLHALHTLKGSARLAGALRLGEMAHRIESEIEYLGSETAAAQDFELLLTRFDAMAHTLEILRKADTAAPAMAFAVSPEAVLMPLQEGVKPGVFVASEPAVSLATTVPTIGKVMIPAPQTMVMQPLRQAASASVRVRSQLLDRMVNQAGEVMITRSRLEVELGQLRGSLRDMTGNLNRLRQQLRDIELQAETQMQSRLAQAKELQAGFDPLEFDRFTRVQELTRMMAESVNDVATVQRTLQRTVDATEDDLIAQARQTRELQRDLLRTRMLEFDGISDRLYRVVRQASKETGKQVRLDLLGGTIEMDRGLLDRMTPAFEHLLRNCVAHGIESPQLRSEAGKDPVGLITVNLRQEGNDVSVEFSDDGAGLDLKRIREKALSLGLVTADQSLNDREAANLIFTPGFSTASQVTELSGRGIGMDVVRSKVNGVGGRIETSTVAGKGTNFKLVLPLTTAVTQVVMVRAGSLTVGVPANVVETVRRASAKELQHAYNTGFLDVAGESVPFFWSGALLQASRRSSETQTKTTPIVVFRSAAQRIALHVDEVLGNQEVVVKNLGPQLSRLPGLAGMSVLASGAVVLIYNPVALASIYGQQARALSADSAEPHALESPDDNPPKLSVLTPVMPQMPLILVVDDSITVRRVTQRLLQREGYRVAMAADGLQALERLQEERPAVVLSDIEMPRMDGFDLARNIRADARLSNLPIVMITSRIAEKHREHAKALGVDHYLGKPYSEEELMSLVRHYCDIEAAIPA